MSEPMFYIDPKKVEHGCCWTSAILRKCKPGEGQYGLGIELICECNEDLAGRICDALNAQEDKFKLLLDAKEIWSNLSNICIDEDENIDTGFMHFEAGTQKLEIWKWIEEKFNVSVINELMNKD